MRTPIHTRIICCWLALLVLLTSTGFGMVEHWCLMRGHTKTLLIAQKECSKPCQSEVSQTATVSGGLMKNGPLKGCPVVKKQPCCKTTLTYEHLDVSGFVAEYHPLPTPAIGVFFPSSFQFLLAALLPPASVTTVLPTADTPLHRTGRFRLTSFCSWLI